MVERKVKFLIKSKLSSSCCILLCILNVDLGLWLLISPKQDEILTNVRGKKSKNCTSNQNTIYAGGFHNTVHFKVCHRTYWKMAEDLVIDLIVLSWSKNKVEFPFKLYCKMRMYSLGISYGGSLKWSPYVFTVSTKWNGWTKR